MATEGNGYADHALFMDTLPADLSSDMTLSALKAINEEELRSLKDSALHWKTIGNDHFQEAIAGRRRRFIDAIDAYSRGLDEFDKFGPRETFDAAETSLRCQLFTNRANAKLKNLQFVEAIDDARKAIALDHTSPKPYFHAARASQGLGLWQQCIDFCEKSFKYDTSGGVLRSLKEQMEKKLSALRAAAAKRSETDQGSEVEALISVLKKERGIDYIATSRMEVPGLCTGNSRVRVIGEEKVQVEWPILFLVEKYGVCDFVAAFNDSMPLISLLKEMFPGGDQFAPWDKEKSFQYSEIECFFDEDHFGPAVVEAAGSQIDLEKSFREEISKISFVYKFVVINIVEKSKF